MTAHLLATVLALAAAGMPDPPGKVKYSTEKGDVTFDHGAHSRAAFARGEGCRACHKAEGPVRKIELDKKAAHLLCVGCHLEKKQGPKACGQCHDDG